MKTFQYRRITAITTLIFLIFCIGYIVVSCNNKYFSDKIVYGKEFTVRGSEKIPLATSDILKKTIVETNDVSSSDTNLSPILSLLPANYISLGNEVSSLDSDDVDEYIIVYATKEDWSVRILIASFDVLLEKYQFVQLLDTNLFGNDKIRIEIKDITGDFQKEIIIIGKNKNGNKTVDIFHVMDIKDNNFDYTNVFTRSATGIDILEKNFDKNKDEFDILLPIFYQIIIYNENIQGEIKKEYFQWDAVHSKFIRVSVDRFNSSDVFQEKLKKLRKAKDIDFQKFLQGGWHKNVNNSSKESSALMLIFSYLPTQITIYQKEGAYIYDWNSSFRSVSTFGGIALQINIKSRILPSIYDWIQLEITTDDTIYLHGSEGIPINLVGEYKKIITSISTLESSYNNYIDSKSEVFNIIDNIVSGNFIDTSSQVVYLFDYPKVRIIKQNNDINAYYGIFFLDNHKILEMHIPTFDSSFYILNQTPDSKTLKLLPISLYADSYYRKFNDPGIELTRNDE